MTVGVAASPPGRDVSGAAGEALALAGITKRYGPTLANEDVSFRIAAGEVVGLIGANGAGKSTLMRILAGVTEPDAGELAIAGRRIELARYTPHGARVAGIRIVHQELSLCGSLTVAENFFVEQPGSGGSGPAWRRACERLARAHIDAIFPASGIDPRARAGTLPIAQRQMVEIARAAASPDLGVLILDEPTSSLDSRRSDDLQRFIGRLAARGVAVIFISHKLHEIAAVTRRVLVMRNGRLVRDEATGAIGVPQMIEAMAGEAAAALSAARPPAPSASAAALVTIGAPFGTAGLTLHAGEIVGLAGLEGGGQPELLHAIRRAARGRRIAGITCGAKAAFVSGDRRGEGVFPLWSAIANATIARIAAGPATAWLRPAGERAEAARWLEAVRLPADRAGAPILDLSGGNQQKVLMARALMAEADIILLDDPTRGVDVAVKREFYRLIRDAAAQGKLIVWHSSETIEFLECDRVCVLHDGAIRRVLAGDGISEDAIVSTAFAEQIGGDGRAAGGERRFRRDWSAAAPVLILAAIFGIIVALNRSVASLFGIGLLSGAAVPLVLVTLAQMVVIGGSEIDLGVGACAGLANVLSATILVRAPWAGALALLLLLGAYALLGWLIQVRAMPAIVVTLGASFIWAGIGYALQPTPGGSAPGWLAAASAWSPAGVSSSVVFIVAALLGGLALNASRIGVVLRGFGANPRAMAQSGWPAARIAMLRYAIAGGFAVLAGLSMTAINTSSDINAGGSYTLLSIAAAVIGGCSLLGGEITALGAVCGALSLSLIGSLLGFLGVSTDYNAAVQGGMLIAILAAREILRWRRA
jgi:ribose transport system ATP-binding protein